MLKIDPQERLLAGEYLKISAKLRKISLPVQNLESDFGTLTENPLVCYHVPVGGYGGGLEMAAEAEIQIDILKSDWRPGE
jgi:hypothetical protein